MLKMRASVGMTVDFVTKTGVRKTGKVIKVAGDVYTIEFDGETKPVHHKYLKMIHKPIYHTQTDPRLQMHGIVLEQNK